MSDLFSASGMADEAPRPLADRLRPQTLSEVVGQDHLLGPDGALGRMLKTGRLGSIIFWGPPGVGKTTIARLLAKETDLEFEAISAVFSGVKDLRAAFDRAENRRGMGKGTLLFVDEIHRFNRAQQDGFLPFVEAGVVTLVGATTENPSFEINGALLSRCAVLTLKRLTPEALEELLQRAEALEKRKLPLDARAREALIDMADGDGRYMLNLAEQAFTLADDGKQLTAEQLSNALQKRAPAYDKDREEHYNLISALHKSVRGSDPDAALYWLARMITGGEDPLYLARRIVRMASEDIGLADPTSLMIAAEAARTYERLGSPEGELALAHAVVHLATAPKSNAVYVAWKSAQRSAKETGSLMPPKHILNAPTAFMKEEGYGKGYNYDHDAEEGFSGQNYFPDGMKREAFYQPKGEGREGPIAERLKKWAELRRQKGS
ncbi:replication-associated recombination protein A [Henriciella mobilis]|uniref:Replication-associated recombination protein A n=1 Tax=Henriciella mobilis TaxID=2305467 RepID=A0A399RS26_9PROT|nr:replication-associated recombination protein A [Henriciella mobilis]RIJ13760.1 replication-associated recombination protein A [Henriciella mobilis]RIJ21032.1 replication-associated recombination protein A [Henriciella mobilis]RIJ32789.1 replication-associated recombination protein A [Henriciella mobilis]